KLFELEEDATIYILLDGSRSMRSKYLYARQLAAALGYIALNSLDRLCVYGLADKLVPLLDPCRGRGNVLKFLASLEEAETFGDDTDFTACSREFQARRKRKGVVIVVSDFLFPSGFEDGLKFLQYHRHDLFCLQVQDDTDQKCDWKGDVNLHCIETNQTQRVTISPAEARAYEQAVADWNDDLRKSCSRRNIGLASTTPAAPFEAVIQEILRRGGLVA
ncbi:MAG: VWA domain-containing protein, partial [Verrucomicrobiota bacterium]